LMGAGFEEESALRALQPLVSGTVDNVGRLGTTKALTGPIVRGDVETVRAHVEALRGLPDGELQLYRALGRHTLEIARRRGTLSAETIIALGEVFDENPGFITVRVFGSLRPSRTDRGLPHEFTAEVPADGIAARELAESFGLPTERVEGVFVNHTVRGLGVRVMPGDCIGFVPNDIPGPHRLYLGLYSAGKDDDF
jgi:hypothetical protein